jgi:transcriptional regulator with XRE-family HTH domain
MKTLGQKIRELRESKDLSLRELAKKVGVSAAFLSDVELGRRYAADKLLSKLARVLETPEQELRSHNTRPPVEDMRRLVISDPQYGLAFRKLIDCEVSSEDLLAFAQEKSRGRKKR